MEELQGSVSSLTVLCVFLAMYPETSLNRGKEERLQCLSQLYSCMCTQARMQSHTHTQREILNPKIRPV